jgi:hypothetical protein
MNYQILQYVGVLGFETRTLVQPDRTILAGYSRHV